MLWDCIYCNDCVNIHLNYHVTLLVYYKRNCYEIYKVFDLNLQRHIALQTLSFIWYKFSAFHGGTFKDIYSPYCAVKYSEEGQKNEINMNV